jgi:predicted alpha/beta-hydrolase family hydrolase
MMSDAGSQSIRIEERPIVVSPNKTVSSIWAIPDAYASHRTAVVVAHGAGNDMSNPFLSYVHEHLAKHGWMSVKFNFPYKELGRKAPDRPAVLEATWVAIIAALRGDERLAPKKLFLSGKSMGGRIASQVVAAGEKCDGLIYLGYPLHPARQPEKLRSKHLADITSPMLFIEGSRDPLCDLALLERELARSPADAKIHVIEDGDHSFKVPKRSGRSEAEIWSEIVATCNDWLREHTVQ